MTGKDFMIGDWVALKDAIQPPIFIKVSAITPPFIQAEGELGQFHEDTIKPIPLTPEILKKNDITLKEVGDHGVLTPKRDIDRFEKWLIHTKWKDTYLWYDRLTKRWCLHGLNGVSFVYVHQLQQALRFSSIDKEIEL